MVGNNWIYMVFEMIEELKELAAQNGDRLGIVPVEKLSVMQNDLIQFKMRQNSTDSKSGL